MTEQEKLWEELESAMPKKKKQKEEKRPDTCSFCKKKTVRLTCETVGGINIYLCKDCAAILEQTRKRLE